MEQLSSDMDIIFASNKAVSNIALYDLTDRAGNVIPSNSSPVSINTDDKDQNKWVDWGIGNTEPEELSKRIKKSGVLSSALGAKARIAIGKGIAPVLITGRDASTGEEIVEWVYDTEIEDWLELNNDYFNSLEAIRDVMAYGWMHQRIRMANGHQKIAGFKTDNVYKCRLGRMNNDGVIDKTYFSPDWTKVKSVKDCKVITALQENNELEDLKAKLSKKKENEYSIITRSHLDGQNYYPCPAWKTVIDWVDLVIKVPEMKMAMFNNQMSIKYMISINVEYFKKGDPKWNSYTAEEKQAKYAAKVQEINDNLAGNDKAYKSISAGYYVDPAKGTEVYDIKVEVLDDKVRDGKLLPESSAGDKQILFSLMMNPAIMGANTFGGGEGGAGSGSDIREAYLVQIMLMEAERRMNSKVLNIVKRFNGWSDKYKGKNLQFRYPNLILRTLDKGGSTEPVNT